MTAPIASFNLSATVTGVSGPIAVGDALVPIGGVYYKATAANVALAGVRAQGIATTAWGSSTAGSVIMQHVGVVDAATVGLGAGTVSWLRVSTAGRLERATVAGADDVVGRIETDGTAFVLFGILTAAIVNGGGGGATLPIDLTSQVTGTLPVGNGGTGTTTATGTGSVVLHTAPSFAGFDMKNAGATGPRYTFTPSAIVATRLVTLPLLTADDVFVFAGFTQTLTGKTLVAASNTITDTSAATGDILRHNGTRFVRLARGSANQVLTTNAGATDIGWAAAGGSGSPGGSTTQMQFNNAGAFGGTDMTYVSGTGYTIATNNTFIYGVDSAATTHALIGIDNANYFTLGGGLIQIGFGADDLIIGTVFGNIFRGSSASLGVSVPTIGLNGPWGSVDGKVDVTIAGANITLSAAQYATQIQRFIGAPAATRTVTYPLPADDAHAYVKTVWVNTTTANNITITNGGGATVAYVGNTSVAHNLIFTSAGVFQVT